MEEGGYRWPPQFLLNHTGSAASDYLIGAKQRVKLDKPEME